MSWLTALSITLGNDSCNTITHSVIVLHISRNGVMATHRGLSPELVVRFHLPQPERKLTVGYLEIKGKEE